MEINDNLITAEVEAPDDYVPLTDRVDGREVAMAQFKAELRRAEIAALTRAALNPKPKATAADRKRAQRSKAAKAAAEGRAVMNAETVQNAILDVIGSMLRGGDPLGLATPIIRAVAQVYSCPEQAAKAISAKLVARSPKIIRD
jgi:hypothetical protein